jgi:putative phosphoesterase
MIGVISDTHGLVRPDVVEIFKGVELIIHAGDIGDSEVLKALETIAPVTAVRGNNDRDTWADSIPHDQVIEYGAHLLFVLHELEHLDLDPVAAEFSVVIYGHSHRPAQEWQKGVLYLNPGSAGPRRFALPVTVARLHIEESHLTAEIITLSV